MGYYADRISINISDKAFYTLLCDENGFDIIHSRTDKKSDKITDSLLNRIIKNMDYDALDKKTCLPASKADHKHFFMKLSKPAYDRLECEGKSECKGTFINFLLEKYSEFPYFEREKIIYKDIIDSINDAHKSDQLIRVSYRNRPDRLLIEPYEIMTDEWSSYNYLIGLDVTNASEENKWRFVNLRIAYIDSNIMRVKKKDDYPIGLPGRSEIFNRIYGSGVQFVSEKPMLVKVRLKEGAGNGKDLYDHMNFMRPRIFIYPTPEEPDVYTFNCTRGQIRFYFFKFGSKAEILEPQSLREEFRTEYENALKQY